ncbi:hypothetical protein [Desulfovibrio ferrophilus]|nr:hypothetical protein [Desulfovibrio ferrophilus]
MKKMILALSVLLCLGMVAPVCAETIHLNSEQSTVNERIKLPLVVLVSLHAGMVAAGLPDDDPQLVELRDLIGWVRIEQQLKAQDEAK